MYAGAPLFCLAALLLTSVGCDAESRAAPDIPPSARSWSAPEAVEESRVAVLIRAASDPMGNAILVWDDLEGEVNAKRYDATEQTWTHAERLDPDNPDDSAIPDLAMDGEGNAIAVWQRQSQVDDTRSVWTNRYDASKGVWGKASPITNSDLVLAPQVVMDRAGNALLAFTRSEIGASVMTARFDVEGGSWSAATPIVPAQGLLAGAPQLAMAPGGTAVAVWADGDLEKSTIWAARYDGQSHSWQDARAIGTRPGTAQPAGVSINEAGTAVAVWAQTEAEKISVYTSRTEWKPAGWSEPVRLDLEGRGDAFRPRIALDEAGNALAIWSADADEHRHVWTNRYDASARSWQGAETLDSGAFDAYAPTLAVQADGHAVALWTHEEASRIGPYASSYNAVERSWSAPRPLESDAEALSEYVALGLTSDGRALAVWSREGKRFVVSHLR